MTSKNILICTSTINLCGIGPAWSFCLGKTCSTMQNGVIVSLVTVHITSPSRFPGFVNFSARRFGTHPRSRTAQIKGVKGRNKGTGGSRKQTVLECREEKPVLEDRQNKLILRCQRTNWSWRIEYSPQIGCK